MKPQLPQFLPSQSTIEVLPPWSRPRGPTIPLTGYAQSLVRGVSANRGQLPRSNCRSQERSVLPPQLCGTSASFRRCRDGARCACPQTREARPRRANRGARTRDRRRLPRGCGLRRRSSSLRFVRSRSGRRSLPCSRTRSCRASSSSSATGSSTRRSSCSCRCSSCSRHGRCRCSSRRLSRSAKRPTARVGTIAATHIPSSSSTRGIRSARRSSSASPPPARPRGTSSRSTSPRSRPSSRPTSCRARSGRGAAGAFPS